MTRDDIICMAKEAGFETDGFGIGIWDSADFNRFAALVANREKELIASWVESWGNDLTVKEIVEGIRTDGNGAKRPVKYVMRGEE